MKHSQGILFFTLLLTSMFFLYFIIIAVNTTDRKYNLNTPLIEKIAMWVIDYYYLWIIHSCLANWIFLTLAIRKTAKILLNDLQVFVKKISFKKY